MAHGFQAREYGACQLVLMGPSPHRHADTVEFSTWVILSPVTQTGLGSFLLAALSRAWCEPEPPTEHSYGLGISLKFILDRMQARKI